MKASTQPEESSHRTKRRRSRKHIETLSESALDGTWDIDALGANDSDEYAELAHAVKRKGPTATERNMAKVLGTYVFHPVKPGIYEIDDVEDEAINDGHYEERRPIIVDGPHRSQSGEHVVRVHSDFLEEEEEEEEDSSDSPLASASIDVNLTNRMEDQPKETTDEDTEDEGDSDDENFRHSANYYDRLMKKYRWSLPEITFLRNLQLRGKDPVFPGDWATDITMALPTSIYATKDQVALIGSLRHRGRGTRAFLELMQIGPRVRPLIQETLPTTRTVRRLFNAGNKWALLDADIGWHSREHKKPRPALVALVFREKGDYKSCEKRMLKMLRKMSQQYNEYAETSHGEDFKPTTLFGIAVAGSTAVLVSKISCPMDTPVRTITTCDFSNKDYDVWNSIAVMLLFQAARDTRRADGPIGIPRSELDSDVDA